MDRLPRTTLSYLEQPRDHMKKGKAILELDARDRLARGLLLIALVAVDIALFIWLTNQGPPAIDQPSNALAIIGLSPDPDPGQPAKAIPEQHSPTSQKSHPIIELAPLPSLALPNLDTSPGAAEDSGTAGGCGLTNQLQTAILQDPASLTELAALPAGTRTEADAVMLWNGQWLDPGPHRSGLIGNPLRDLVERLVSAAPEQCRLAAWTGPQFIAIAQGQRTTMLVVGSGLWRWQDLLTPPACSEKQASCSANTEQSTSAIN